MVASGVLPVGAMRPRLSASSVTSRVVRGRLADFRMASAAARKVIGSDGNGGKDEPVAARSSAAVGRQDHLDSTGWAAGAAPGQTSAEGPGHVRRMRFVSSAPRASISSSSQSSC